MHRPRSPSYLGGDAECPVEGPGQALLRTHCDGDSSRYMGYSDTMQLMVKAGVNPVEEYHRGAPQIVYLDLECKGEPLVKYWKVPTNEVAEYNGSKLGGTFRFSFRFVGGRNPGPDSCSGRIPAESGRNIPDVPPFLLSTGLTLLPLRTKKRSGLI